MNASPAEQPDRSVSHLSEGTVTVLFTDVEASTGLRTREGDEVATRVLRAHERMAREEIERHGGHEAGFMGDGFMVVFGSARQALECATAMQRRFERYNRTESGPRILVRMGLNVGEVRREGAQFYGSAINAAARIAARARGGEILASQLIRDVASPLPDLEFRDRGQHLLKGFPDRWHLYEVVWSEARSSKGRAADPRLPPPGSWVEPLDETYARPSAGPLIGRQAELDTIESALRAALAGQIRVISVDGEAGIGKTRLLEAAVGVAAARGFQVVMVAGDEELRGPFFLVRALLASAAVERLAEGARATEELVAARAVLWGRDDASAGLPANERLLRVYDVVTLALRAVASVQPLALFFDDIQWADEDSLKLIRYLVRTCDTMPICILLANRPERGPAVSAATTLVADLERQGHGARMKLDRLGRDETRALLEQVLGTPVSLACATTLHTRGEGVPFFIVEFARAFQAAGLFQTVEGRLEVSAAAGSTVPPTVQILLERRLAQLSNDARSVLEEAAILGRRFRVAELAALRAGHDGPSADPDGLEARLAPAVGSGLVVELPETAAYDFAFTHDEVRAALLGAMPRGRRRAAHAALVELLADQEETPNLLPSLAHHSLEAGDIERGVDYSIRAARAALDALAPEAALRTVVAAQSVAASPDRRATLLTLRDDALNALGRGHERLATLAELQALSRALRDRDLEVDVTLRRASAARQLLDYEQAAELARDVRALAAAEGDDRAELSACLELGQALMRAALGEAFSPPTSEVDLDGAAEAYERGAALAARVGDEPVIASLKRELGIVEIGRVRRMVLEMLAANPLAFEEPDFDPLQIPGLRAGFEKARELVDEAIEAFERLGNHRGAMASLIAMAYASIIEDTTAGHAGRLEQIRRLRRNLRRLTSDSERAESEAHMLYAIHVYARSHGPFDLALARGVETFEAARSLGDEALSFLAAGGVALTHATLEQPSAAREWLDRAGTVVLQGQGSPRARQLEAWRGMAAALAGDAEGMRAHLERALQRSPQRCAPGDRCDVLVTLAMEAARLGADAEDPALLESARAWAVEGLDLARALPASDAPFTAQGLAAVAQVALAEGDLDGARETGLTAAEEFLRTRQYYPFAQPQLWLVISRAIAETDDPTARRFRTLTAMDLTNIAAETRDDEIRARWLGTRVIRELVDRVAASPGAGGPASNGVDRSLSPREIRLLRGVMSGETTAEMAASLGERDGAAFGQELDVLFRRIGARNRREAAAAAVRRGIA